MHEELLFPILSEIVKGYSPAIYEKQPLFIKHPSFGTELELAAEYKKYYDQYRANGLPTIEERLAFLKEEGEWTDKDEAFIETQKKFLSNLHKTLAKMVIPAQVDELKRTINETEDKIGKKIIERESLLGVTCEASAKNKKREIAIVTSLFSDERLAVRFVSEEDWEYLDPSVVSALSNLYYKTVDKFTDDNLKRIALSGIFFNLYSIIPRDNPAALFSKGIWDLTFFQQRLLRYAQDARLIYENVHDIPDEIRSDYDALVDFSRRDRNTLKQKGGNMGYSVVGASRKDMAKAGVDVNGAISLNELAQKSGKTTLKKKDFLNAAG